MQQVPSFPQPPPPPPPPPSYPAPQPSYSYNDSSSVPSWGQSTTYSAPAPPYSVPAPPYSVPAPTPSEAFAAAFPPPPANTVAEIRTLPDAVRASIRIFAPIMLGLGILCMISGGLCVISSVLIIVQGALWLRVSSSPATLAKAVSELRIAGVAGCCSSTTNNLRNLAISAIVFSSLELLVGFGAGLGLGVWFLTRSFFCSNFFPFNCSQRFNGPYLVGQWLLFASGTSLITGALNISMSVLTLHTLQLLSNITSSPVVADPQPQVMVAAPNGKDVEVSVNPLAGATQAQAAWAQEAARL